MYMYIHRALFPMLQELIETCLQVWLGDAALRLQRLYRLPQSPWPVTSVACHRSLGVARVAHGAGAGHGGWFWMLEVVGFGRLEQVGTCWNMLSARFLRLISDFFACDHLRHLLSSHIRILCGCSFSLLLMRRTESHRINISHMSEPCLTSFWTFQPWQQDGMSLFGGVYSGFIVVIILPYVPMTSTCHYVILICFNPSLRIRN